MSTLVAEIAAKFQQLNSAEKNDLLRLLMLDINGPVDEDADEAWRNEIVHRVRAIRNGEAAIKALQEEWQE